MLTLRWLQTECAEPSRKNAKAHQHIYGNMPRGGRRHVRMVSFMDLTENFKCFGVTYGFVN